MDNNNEIAKKKESREEKKNKRFIKRIVEEAVMHLWNTYEDSRKMSTRVSYRKRDYEKIKENIAEINSIANTKYNIIVILDAPDIGENEVRFSYLEQ